MNTEEIKGLLEEHLKHLVKTALTVIQPPQFSISSILNFENSPLILHIVFVFFDRKIAAAV